MRKDPLIGKKIGKYKLTGFLGKGAMGRVYEALDPDGAVVALKILEETILITDRAIVRFKREAESAKELRSHANIITVYDTGQKEKIHWIAMERINGPTLDEVLNGDAKIPGSDEEGIPVEKTMEVIAQIASALDYAHSHERWIAVDDVDLKIRRNLADGLGLNENGECVTEDGRRFKIDEDGKNILMYEHQIIHRDIKPANVMINQWGNAILTDFGLATLESRPRMTASGEMVGTPYYMSPEQTMDRGLDGRSDIWSLGVMLYELLINSFPFDIDYAKGETMADLVNKIRGDEPAPLKSYEKDIDADLKTITLKCLEKNPVRRYQTAGELKEDLERYSRDEPILAKPINIFERGYRKLKRNKIMAAGLAVLLVLGINIGWWAASQRPVVKRYRIVRTLYKEVRDLVSEGKFLEAERKLSEARKMINNLVKTYKDDARFLELKKKMESLHDSTLTTIVKEVKKVDDIEKFYYDESKIKKIEAKAKRRTGKLERDMAIMKGELKIISHKNETLDSMVRELLKENEEYKERLKERK